MPIFTPFAILAPGAPASNYPLTDNFIAATSITSSTIISALQTLETDLNTYSLLSKFDAIYPFVGGTADTCKYNFLDTGSYTLSYTGSFTYSNNGVAGDGSTAKANTSIPGTMLDPDIGNTTVYIRDNIVGGSSQASFPIEVGVNGDIYNPNLTQYYINVYTSTGNNYFVHPCNNETGQGNGSVITATTSSQGCWTMSRTSNTSLKAYINGTQLGSTNTTSLAGRSYSTFTDNIELFGAKNAYSRRQVAWVSIGTSAGLDDTETANLYTAIQTFQTALSRQI